MGYMGFGMKKEVYTRKPKVAFEKIKRIYGNETKKSKSSLNNRSKKVKGRYVRVKYKHFRDTLFYKIMIIVIIAIIFIVGYVLSAI